MQDIRELFCTSAIGRFLAIQRGDVRAANQFAAKLSDLGHRLAESNSLENVLFELLTHEHAAVRYSAATRLARLGAPQSLGVLRKIARGEGILALEAGLFLNEFSPEVTESSPALGSGSATDIVHDLLPLRICPKRSDVVLVGWLYRSARGWFTQIEGGSKWTEASVVELGSDVSLSFDQQGYLRSIVIDVDESDWLLDSVHYNTDIQLMEGSLKLPNSTNGRNLGFYDFQTIVHYNTDLGVFWIQLSDIRANLRVGLGPNCEALFVDGLLVGFQYIAQLHVSSDEVTT